MIAVFRDECGHEAIVHLHGSYGVEAACEDHPEWSLMRCENPAVSNARRSVWVSRMDEEDLWDLY